MIGYKIEIIKGIFISRSRKDVMLKNVCADLGKDDWELCHVVYDWFMVKYTLIFKRRID